MLLKIENDSLVAIFTKIMLGDVRGILVAIVQVVKAVSSRGTFVINESASRLSPAEKFLLQSEMSQ